MIEATVIIMFTLRTEDEISDPQTYFQQSAEALVESIPTDWWHSTEESLHIADAHIGIVKVGP